MLDKGVGPRGGIWAQVFNTGCGSLLTSIWLCGQQQGGNSYQLEGQYTKIWIPPLIAHPGVIEDSKLLAGAPCDRKSFHCSN